MNNITIEYLFRLFLRRLWIIILVAVICGASAFTYCNWFADEAYSATAKIIIGNGALGVETESGENSNQSSELSQINPYYISGSHIQSSMYLAKESLSFLRTNEIYQRLAFELDGNRNNYGRYKGCISIDLAEEDSIFINITATSSTPDEAVKIANAFASLTPDYFKEKFKQAEADIIETADGAGQTAPRTTTTTILFAVAGALIVYILALIIDMNDKTIKGEMDFTETYNIPLLGSVPDFEDATTSKGGYYGNGTK